MLVEGPPALIAADPRVRQVYLGERVPRVTFAAGPRPRRRVGRLWRHRRARTDRARPAAGRHDSGGARPQRRRQDHPARHDHGPHHGCAAARSVSPDATSSALPAFRRARLGIGFVPQEREIFPSLTVAENLMVAARPGRWSLARVYDFFPPLAERRASPRQPALGRRAADAGDRPGADRQSRRSC